MAYPTNPVNAQITDSITQSNVKILGEEPAVALGSIYQMDPAMRLQIEESVKAQQENRLTAQAATSQGIAGIYKIDTVNAGYADQEISDSLKSLLATLQAPK